LSAAVSRQRADIVELLLQNGAKVHVGSPSRTPMDLAVKNGGMTIIGLLLRALENE
jgi:ankyrin repeat protein